MNINSTPTPSWYVQIQHGLYTNIYKTDERHVPSSFWFEIGDFVFQDESKKRFLYVNPAFSPAGHYKDMFLPEHDALFMEFFTFTLSNYCNKQPILISLSFETLINADFRKLSFE